MVDSTCICLKEFHIVDKIATTILDEELEHNPELLEAVETARRFKGWNYRVMRHFNEQDGSYFDAIHEVYYDEHGNPVSWVDDQATPYDEVDENGCSGIREDLLDMLKAVGKPLLDFETGKPILIIDDKYKVSYETRENNLKNYISQRKK